MPIVGRPPWSTDKVLPSGDVALAEAYIGMESQPWASGRSFEEWCQDYCSSRRAVKDLKFKKVIYGWNTQALENSLESLIRTTGFHNSITIKFEQSSTTIHVRSPSIISRIFSSLLAKILLSLILVFPFLWLWRRYWPGAGGKWEVMGSAFALDKWERVYGTSAEETVEEARNRLSVDDFSWIADDVIAAKKLRRGPGGVWIAKGVQEGEFYREWEQAIRMGVVNREKIAWLPKVSTNKAETLVALAGQALEGY